MPNGASSIHAPLCPRCAYDQSGLVASWTHACPLRATCTECGYAYQPADAVDPLRKRLGWLYEHRRVWSLLAAIKTLAMLIWPPLFWKRVRPEHEVRVRMLACWVALLLVATFVIASVSLWVSVSASDFYQTRLNVRHSPQPSRIVLRPMFSLDDLPKHSRTLLGARVVNAFGYTHRMFPASILAAPAFTAAAFAVLIALPSHWRRERVAPKHFVRVAVYSLTPGIVIYAAFAFVHVYLWGRQAILLYMYLYSQAGFGARSLPKPTFLEELASGRPYIGLLALATAWQILFLASALRTGLRLRSWLGLWMLASACGLGGVAIVSTVRIVWEISAW